MRITGTYTEDCYPELQPESFNIGLFKWTFFRFRDLSRMKPNQEVTPYASKIDMRIAFGLVDKLVEFFTMPETSRFGLRPDGVKI